MDWYTKSEQVSSTIPTIQHNLYTQQCRRNTLGTSRGEMEGYVLILQPLPPGRHDICFNAIADEVTSTSTQNFVNGVTHHLTVQ